MANVHNPCICNHCLGLAWNSHMKILDLPSYSTAYFLWRNIAIGCQHLLDSSHFCFPFGLVETFEII